MMKETEIAYDALIDAAMEEIDKLIVAGQFDKIDFSKIGKFNGTPYEKVFQDFIFDNPVATFTGVKVDNEKIFTDLLSGKTYIIESDQGLIIVTHGMPNGYVVIPDNGGLKLVHYCSDEFEETIEQFAEGQDKVYLLSCYPGSRCSCWITKHGIIVNNIGEELRPLTLISRDGELAVNYISRHHQELIENEVPILMQKVAIAKAAAAME